MFKRSTLALLLLSLTALAADAKLDLGKSNITATFKQEGVPVDARFTRFSGQISYDPAHVETASANLDVDTGSLDLGDAAYNAETRKKPWFDSATYPNASFRSTSIKALSATQFSATGTLTLKGRTQPITVPVTAKTNGNARTFEGSFVISRQAFGIGSPEWNDVLEDKVTVHFVLVNAP